MNKGRIVVSSNGVVLATADEITIGTRTGNEVVVDDPIAADRHCRITFDGSFQLRDLGSVTGTWLDGRRAGAFAELHDGASIVIGASRLVAAITKDAAGPTLTLDLQRCSFWWKKPGKGVFDNDPDAHVRSEVAFGRFPLLHAINRVAVIAAAVLIVAAVLIGAVFDRLVDAGPLAPAHAALRAITADQAGVHASVVKCAQLAAEQGCHVCHERGGGTPMTKCMQCHGDMADRATWRHPFFGDGKVDNVPGIDAGESFCALCHRDHEGRDFLKAKSQELLGKCEVCHRAGDAPFDRAALLAKGPETRVVMRERQHSSIRFPHDRHTASGMRCDLCHVTDPAVAAAHDKGLDDPDRDDHAGVPFTTCAACHVPGTGPGPGMTAAEQASFREQAKDQQWQVRWHGTADGGKGCAACHVRAERGGASVFGPELTTVERAVDTVDAYATGRATFVAARRLHDDEFKAHAAGRQCLECHVRGSLVAEGTPRAATFWHALHLADAALAPLPGNAGAVSRDAKAGCTSCHHDLETAKALRAAADGAFTWGTDEAAQAACRTCHHDAGKANVLRATASPVPADRRRQAIAFPHDVHVGSGHFGAPGSSLADGCFACHEFATPTGGTVAQMVPRTKAKAADCTACHSGHDDIAGGSCQKCHPKADGRADSFTLAAHVADRKPPVRRWPAANEFSHASAGHSGTDLDGKPITCAVCHDEKATLAAKTVADVPVPDESLPVCRQCHVQRQFHWR